MQFTTIHCKSESNQKFFSALIESDAGLQRMTTPPCFLLFMVMVDGLQSSDLYFSTVFPYLCILPPKGKENQKSHPTAIAAPPLSLHDFCCCRYHCQCQSHGNRAVTHRGASSSGDMAAFDVLLNLTPSLSNCHLW